MADILFVARHGETVWNVEDRIQGRRCDSPLTALGVAQATALADVLAGAGIGRVFCSSQGRAVQTATVIAGWIGCSMTPDSRLDERDLSIFEGRKKTELADESAWGRGLVHPTESESRAPGGESMGDAATRILPFLKTVRELPECAVAAVTHSHVLQALLGVLMGTQDYEMFRHTNTAYSIIRWVDDQPKVVRWDVADHLQLPVHAVAGDIGVPQF